jgi:hypothetical protein
MKRSYILIVFIFTACKNLKSDCSLTAEELLQGNRGKVHVIRDKNKKIIGISDTGLDGVKVGAYYFYPNGELNSYKFFQTDSAYNYDELYDKSGQIARIVGKPLVNTEIREVNIDSTFITFYFFSLHKVYKTMEIVTTTNLKSAIKLIDDTLYSNMKVATFGMNTKGLVKFKIYSSCEYVNECTLRSEIIRDTLSLIKNPRLNLIDAK